MTGFWRPPYRSDFAIARGGGGGGEQRSVQSTQIPPFLEAAGEQALGKAQTISDRPYEANPYANVAPMTADQTNAYSTIRNLQGSADPAYAAAQGAITGGGLLGSVKPITTGQVNTDAAALMNPYITSVVDPATTQMRQALDMSLGKERANASNIGAFGGSRLGVQEGIAKSQESLQEGQYVGGLLSQGYQNAQQAAIDLATKNMAGGEWATTQLPQLASAQVGEQAKEAGLLEQAGRAVQGQSQAEIDQQAQNWETQWNYPTEALSVLESVLGTTPHGSTTTTTGPAPQSNTAGQVIGGVGAAASLIGALAML